MTMMIFVIKEMMMKAMKKGMMIMIKWSSLPRSRSRSSPYEGDSGDQVQFKIIVDIMIINISKFDVIKF